MRVRPNIDETTQPKIYEDYHKYRIYGLKFHPTEANIFATGGWDRSLKVIIFRFLFFKNADLSIEFNQLGNKKNCSETEFSVQVWDVRVPAAVFSINGPLLSGDSLDIYVSLINVATTQTLSIK